MLVIPSFDRFISRYARMVRFEALVLKGKVRHNGHKVLTWNVSNANVQRKSTGLMYLNKAGKTLRIDGLAAVINAMRGVVDLDGAAGQETSVYEERGLVSLRGE